MAAWGSGRLKLLWRHFRKHWIWHLEPWVWLIKWCLIIVWTCSWGIFQPDSLMLHSKMVNVKLQNMNEQMTQNRMSHEDHPGVCIHAVWSWLTSKWLYRHVSSTGIMMLCCTVLWELKEVREHLIAVRDTQKYRTFLLISSCETVANKHWQEKKLPFFEI